MRVFERSLGIAASALVLAALPAVAEDLTIVFKDNTGGTRTEYFTAAKMRTSGGDTETIMDFSTGTMTMIDNKKKEYSQITVEQMEAAMKQAQAQMAQAQAQMEQAMAKVPPEMRERMQQMAGGMGAAFAGAITVTKGGTRKVAGYDTQQYTITMGEMMKRDVWNTTSLQLPFDPAQFRRMSGFANPAASGPMMQGMAKVAEKMKEVQGFTLAETMSIKMMGRGNDTSREAVEVKKGPIPANAFAVPAGYKKVDSPMLKMGQAGKR
jgi:hypothetical protein